MRVEFPKSVRLEAFRRCGGVCEVHRLANLGLDETCDAVASELDHIRPCVLGGEATLENSAFLCRRHHREKTNLDLADKSKRNKHKVRDDRPDSGWFPKGKSQWPKGRKLPTGRKMQSAPFRKKES
jgi:5-methylcytosine-specific restriction endonuclease McrA